MDYHTYTHIEPPHTSIQQNLKCDCKSTPLHVDIIIISSSSGVPQSGAAPTRERIADDEPNPFTREATLMPPLQPLTPMKTTPIEEDPAVAIEKCDPIPIAFEDICVDVKVQSRPEGKKGLRYSFSKLFMWTGLGGGGTTTSKRILFNLSGRIEPGRLVAVMGSSGAGKSTLLNGREGEMGRIAT